MTEPTPPPPHVEDWLQRILDACLQAGFTTAQALYIITGHRYDL